MPIARIGDTYNREQKVREGKYWFATAFVDLGAVATRVNHMIENPTGSGINAFFTRIEVGGNVGANYPKIFQNPTGNLPTTRLRSINAIVGDPDTSKVNIKFDTPAEPVEGDQEPTGGEHVGYAVGNGAALGGTYQSETPPILIPEGNNIVISSRYVAAVTLNILVEWWEETNTGS